MVVGALPVPAGKAEQSEDDCSQQHAAPTEVEGQVVGPRPVKEPPWMKVMEKSTLCA